MRKAMIVLGWVLSIVCLYFFFRNNQRTQMIMSFRQANYLMLPLIVAVYLFGYVTRAWRWHFLIKTIKRVPFRRLFSVLVIGFMANNILPLRMGEVVRAYLFGKREEISKSASLATIMVERLFDGLTILCFFSVSSAILSGAGAIVKPLKILSVLGIFLFPMGVCLCLLFYRNKSLKLAERFLGVLPRGLAQKIHMFLDRFIDGLAVLKNPLDLIAVAFLSLLSWSIESYAYYLVALAFNVPISLPMVFLLMSVVNLAILVPSTPGGLGVFEGSGLAILVLFSVQAELARCYILAVHIVVLVPIILLGLFFLGRYHLSVKDLQQSRG